MRLVLGIGENVAALVSELGIALGPERRLSPRRAPDADRPWWRRTALHRGVVT